MKIALLTSFTIITFLSGCAKAPEKVATAYVSPLLYQSYDCKQLSQEINRVGQSLQEVTQIQAEEASDDSTTMAIGLILFLPSLFFLEGDTGREGELARLKGEVIAIEKAAIQKNCADVLIQMADEKERVREMKKQADEQAKKQAEAASQRI